MTIAISLLGIVGAVMQVISAGSILRLLPSTVALFY